jgi:cytochrome P450
MEHGYTPANGIEQVMKKKSSSPFATAEYKANPYEYYEKLRRDMPVYKTHLPNGTEVYVVSRYEDVLAGLKDGRLIKDVGKVRGKSFWELLGIGHMRAKTMLRADPPEHGRLRSLANEAFKPKYVRELRGRIQQIADGLVDKVQAKGEMEFISEFAFPLPIRVICEMLGIPAKDQDKFRKWSGELINSGALSSERPVISPNLLQFVQYVRREVDDHRKNPGPDIVTQLIEAEDKGDRLSDAEVVSTVVLLLVAGHETTVNLIGNGMLALLLNPEQLERLKREPALMKSAIEELLRFVNPVQLVNRYAAERLQIAGEEIPAGSHLVLMLGAADHDPICASDPEQLDLARADAKHVAFGQGIHYCLGAPLARLEGEIAFATLLNRLPNVRLAAPPETLKWRPAVELRGLAELPVTF